MFRLASALVGRAQVPETDVSEVLDFRKIAVDRKCVVAGVSRVEGYDWTDYEIDKQPVSGLYLISHGFGAARSSFVFWGSLSGAGWSGFCPRFLSWGSGSRRLQSLMCMRLLFPLKPVCLHPTFASSKLCTTLQNIHIRIPLRTVRSSVPLAAAASIHRNMAKAGDPTMGTEVGTVTMWGFYLSSCTWRVRLALGLKGIPYEYKPLNLSKGEHKSEEYKKISPLQYVPAVEVDGVPMADSMAIVMYFEERFPDKRPLLPVDLLKRAIVRQVVFLIGANIQPLQSPGALKMVEEIADADARLKWAQDHIKIGFTALEQLLTTVAGKYSVGDELTLADVFLVPQIGNANRFKVDVTQFPTIDRIGKALLELPEVQASLPVNQPDAPK